MNEAIREHLTPEQKLQELIAQDIKLCDTQDKLAADLQGVKEKRAQLAGQKAEIVGQLTSFYKKQRNGKGK